MSDPNTIEARLAALEAAVAAIQQRLGPPPHRTAADLIDSLPKIEDVEALMEATRLGREILNAQDPPPADEAAGWADRLPTVSDPEALDEAMRLARELLRADEPPAGEAAA